MDSLHRPKLGKWAAMRKHPWLTSWGAILVFYISVGLIHGPVFGLGYQEFLILLALGSAAAWVVVQLVRGARLLGRASGGPK